MLAISLSANEFQWLRKKKKDEKWLAIRIFSQVGEVSMLSKRFHAQFDDTLVTHFTDITQEVEEDGKIYKPFGIHNYEEIIEFVNKHKRCDKLYVHCHAGICRSAGVVVGLANKYKWIDSQHGLEGKSEVYPYPNVVSWFESTTNN